MTPPLLEVSDLTVAFRSRHAATVEVVRGVSFDLDRGQRLGLVGESGCGKSTTLLALMGLLPPNAVVGGSILLDGVDILAGGERSMRPHRWTDLAMVFQGSMNAFNPVVTVGAQIVEAMRIHKRAKGAAALARARELLELVGIPGARASRYPHEFSGGMRQRAALAMALANDPRVLLADEPTTALDVMVQAQVLDLLERLTEELGLSLLLVTHDLPMVVETCDTAALMYAGRIIECGPTPTLHQAPRHPYTRMLFSAVPDLSSDAVVHSIPGSPPRLDRDFAGCSFAPRCDRATDLCRAEAPASLTLTDRHSVECHFATHPSAAGSS
jgi:oligopeptide/dipeptide ABC transporter ATP-binding protein